MWRRDISEVSRLTTLYNKSIHYNTIHKVMENTKKIYELKTEIEGLAFNVEMKLEQLFMAGEVDFRNVVSFEFNRDTSGTITQIRSMKNTEIFGNKISVSCEDGEHLLFNIGPSGVFSSDSERAEIYKILGFVLNSEEAKKYFIDVFRTKKRIQNQIEKLEAVMA